jgi:hypothetical protein
VCEVITEQSGSEVGLQIPTFLILIEFEAQMADPRTKKAQISPICRATCWLADVFHK